MEERSGWQLPTSYGDPAAEKTIVREHAGLIDIGDGGKIDLKAANLDLVLSDALSGESSGATILRLAPDQALILTLSDQRDSTLDRLTRAVTQHDCAHAVDLSGALCGLRLLGPKAPAVLERLSTLDLAPDRFPDGAVTQGAVARIHAIVARRDAAWERLAAAAIPGYDLYVDRDLGAYLWGTILEAGAPLGLRPVGRAVEEELR
jgi:heterotetrameric sarcosine oxidase gamma subunit